MAIPRAVMYGGAAVAGIAAGAGLGAAFASHDKAKLAEHREKINSMPADELREAVKKGGPREPTSLGLMIPSMVGAAGVGLGVASIPIVGLINLIDMGANGGRNLMTLKGPLTMAAAGAGLIAGAAGFAAAQHFMQK